MMPAESYKTETMGMGMGMEMEMGFDSSRKSALTCRTPDIEQFHVDYQGEGNVAYTRTQE
jgi:hypothetical protein